MAVMDPVPIRSATTLGLDEQGSDPMVILGSPASAGRGVLVQCQDRSAQRKENGSARCDRRSRPLYLPSAYDNRSGTWSGQVNNTGKPATVAAVMTDDEACERISGSEGHTFGDEVKREMCMALADNPKLPYM
ncbi:hypothetical protein NL676_027349 [Syzygium grande]|nr:hypothetical protein NL676_027349 [Syzygium grande]